LAPPGSETIAFHQLPEIVTRFLSHPDPIIIPYTIRIDQDYNFHSKCFDIPIEMEDPQKSKMSQIVTQFEGAEGVQVAQLEDKVAELAYLARDLKQKRDFLESFAYVPPIIEKLMNRSNPHVFIQNWLAAQARDLDQMLGYQVGTIGTNGGSVREEDLRRSDLFSLPWVDEAVTIHEAARMEAERKGMHGGR
jgi:SWI/SNF-related matrix-associated actin-dependent regulator of chromatin subfamily D